MFNKRRVKESPISMIMRIVHSKSHSVSLYKFRIDPTLGISSDFDYPASSTAVSSFFRTMGVGLFLLSASRSG